MRSIGLLRPARVKTNCMFTQYLHIYMYEMILAQYLGSKHLKVYFKHTITSMINENINKNILEFSK